MVVHIPSGKWDGEGGGGGGGQEEETGPRVRRGRNGGEGARGRRGRGRELRKWHVVLMGEECG